MANHYCVSMPYWICYPEYAPQLLESFSLLSLDIAGGGIKLQKLQGASHNFGENKMTTNVKSMLETVERIFTATHTVVETLNVGERIQVKDLAQSVGLAVAMEPKQVLNFVNYFVHNTDLVYVTRGKNGGVIRGVKPAKVVKESKKTDVADSTQTV